MERIIINHQNSRERDTSNNEKRKNLLWEKYQNKENISKESLILDHIIPFSICKDNSLPNLQLLNPSENKVKTSMDLRIIKKFIKMGWIEKITNYSHELKQPIPFLKEEYVKMFGIENLRQVGQVGQR